MRLPALLAVVLLLPVPAFAGPASDAVRFFYSPPVFEGDPELRDRFVDPARKIFEANDKTPEGEIGCIDFGVAVDAQDYDEAEIARTLKLSENVSGDTAEVTATFQLFPDEAESRREIVWSLVKAGGDWKVSDVASRTNDWRRGSFECGE